VPAVNILGLAGYLVTEFRKTTYGYTVYGLTYKPYKGKKKTTYRLVTRVVEKIGRKPKSTDTPTKKIYVADFETDFVKVYKEDGSIDREKSSAYVWLWIARPLELPTKEDYDRLMRQYEETGLEQLKPTFDYVTDENWKQFYDIGQSIESFFDWINSHETETDIYFHNADFDYKFIAYELVNRGYTLAPKIFKNSKPKNIEFKESDQDKLVEDDDDYIYDEEHKKESKQKSYDDYVYDKMTVQQSICNRRFYGASFYNVKGKKINILDSFKQSMSSIASLGKGIGMPKLEMDEGYSFRGRDYVATESDLNYARRDVDIDAITLKKFLEVESGRTIASRSYKQLQKEMYNSTGYDFRRIFPEYDLDMEYEYFRPAYRGGYVYVNPMYQNKHLKNIFGSRIDKTSMHPTMMIENRLPCGHPEYFKGKPEPLTYEKSGDLIKGKVDENGKLFILKCDIGYEVKPNCPPPLQLFAPGKSGTDYNLSTFDFDNGIKQNLCVTGIDLQLIFENCDVFYFEPIDGYYFKSVRGAFDKFVYMHYDGKNGSTGAQRLYHKLYLNSPTGKLGTNPNQKTYSWEMKDGILTNVPIESEPTTPEYTPAIAYILSYTRKDLFSVIKKTGWENFLYCDTDSVHTLLHPAKLAEIMDLDPVKLGGWKHEFILMEAKFIRAKCYMEYGLEPTSYKALQLEDKNIIHGKLPTGKWVVAKEPYSQYTEIWQETKPKDIVWKRINGEERTGIDDRFKDDPSKAYTYYMGGEWMKTDDPQPEDDVWVERLEIKVAGMPESCYNWWKDENRRNHTHLTEKELLDKQVAPDKVKNKYGEVTFERFNIGSSFFGKKYKYDVRGGVGIDTGYFTIQEKVSMFQL